MREHYTPARAPLPRWAHILIECALGLAVGVLIGLHL